MDLSRVLATKGSRVITARPAQSIRDAIALLAKHNIEAMVVVDAEDQPVGMLDRQGIIQAIDECLPEQISEPNKWLASLMDQVFVKKIDSLMTKDVKVGSLQDDLQSVANSITEKRVGYLPIMNSNKGE